VGGVPARQISTVEEVLARRRAETAALPWADLLRQRRSYVDPALEVRLRAARRVHFYPEG
jgi:hypothetical protein